LPGLAAPGKLAAMRALALLLALTLAAPAVAADIKLATWNLAWLTLRPAGDPAVPPDVPRRDAADHDRLAGYARRLNADVIALQEVDGAEAAERVFDPRRYRLEFAEENDVQRVGFAVLRSLSVTRHPDLAALDLRPTARYSLRRGVDITVRVGAQPLRLLAVHLSSSCHEQPLNQGASPQCQSLAQQVPILGEWIAARRREGVAFAVLGDFNRRLNPRDEMWQALTQAAPLASATQGWANPCWARAGSGSGGRPFIDHILLGGPAQQWWRRDSLKVMVYAETELRFRELLSDHCPVSIQLTAP
jgi:endonuclease/exonuclease/phosphatase family metal-dependent hydrolase